MHAVPAHTAPDQCPGALRMFAAEIRANHHNPEGFLAQFPDLAV